MRSTSGNSTRRPDPGGHSTDNHVNWSAPPGRRRPRTPTREPPCPPSAAPRRAPGTGRPGRSPVSSANSRRAAAKSSSPGSASPLGRSTRRRRGWPRYGPPGGPEAPPAVRPAPEQQQPALTVSRASSSIHVALAPLLPSSAHRSPASSRGTSIQSTGIRIPLLLGGRSCRSSLSTRRAEPDQRLHPRRHGDRWEDDLRLGSGERERKIRGRRQGRPAGPGGAHLREPSRSPLRPRARLSRTS
jgi:hypothetical protein